MYGKLFLILLFTSLYQGNANAGSDYSDLGPVIVDHISAQQVDEYGSYVLLQVRDPESTSTNPPDVKALKSSTGDADCIVDGPSGDVQKYNIKLTLTQPFGGEASTLWSAMYSVVKAAQQTMAPISFSSTDYDGDAGLYIPDLIVETSDTIEMNCGSGVSGLPVVWGIVMHHQQ